jgi:predicted phosphoribosyltransferase
MNFIDRTALGETLAQRIQEFHGKDAIIICLQKSSLLTCITVASQLRAWIYPLLYEPVFTDDHARTLLGAYDQNGEFCPVPVAGTKEDTKEQSAEVEKIIKKQKTAAKKAIRKQLKKYGMAIDQSQLNGRDIIIAGDVVTSTLPLVVVQNLLKDVTPRSLTAVVGNVTPDVAQLVRLSAGKSEILDILSGVYYDEDRYFEHADTYTEEQKYTLTQHIATYWQ